MAAGEAILDVMVLESYHGGSHAAFVDTFMAGSRHCCRLARLPARKWKWRMRGAAMWLLFEDRGWLDGPIDVLLCSDMLDVAALRAMGPRRLSQTPMVCYFHENQLTYPLSEHDRRDYQYAVTNITSCLASDEVWFNSAFHRDSFLSAATAFIEKMPDYRPRSVIETIRQRSRVVMPGVDMPGGHTSGDPNPVDRHGPPRVLWCHRWEFDKNPQPFLAAMAKLSRAGIAFELVLTGEQFRTAPPAFAAYREVLAPHVVHEGFIEHRAAYLETVSSCDVVVSSAIQENFGLAVVEAIACGARPVLPNRLAYPEIIPQRFHQACLYESDDRLYDHLRAVLCGDHGAIALPELSAELRRRFAADARVADMDDHLARVHSRDVAFDSS